MTANKKTVKLSLLVLPLLVIISGAKFLLGYKYALIADGVIFLFLSILFLIYFIFNNSDKIFKIQIYTIIFHGVILGTLIPALEFISTSYTLFYGLINVLPMLFYFMLLRINNKNNKNI